MGRVLVVDDEQSLRDALEVLIAGQGHTVETCPGVKEAQECLDAGEFDVVVTDLRLEPGGDGLDVVRKARRKNDPPEVIVMTAFGTRDKALEAQRDGALFYTEKGPHLASDLRVLVTHAINKRRLELENAHLRRVLSGRYSLGGIVGKSEAMQEVLELVERIAPTHANVLISGESGTGKERIAKAIHFLSDRREGPFVPINCGAVPETLIESELFGHVKGAFTGADTAKRGLFATAQGGTIFLDEVGELPLSLQPKLLRVLQERTIKPVGSALEEPVDVRVISATNRELEAEVKAGRFREDLFFRLNVVEVDLPPLRLRREDIPLLAQTFLDKYSKEYRRDLRTISPEVMKRLLGHHYPGNVRQLENVIERGVALASGSVLLEAHLPKDFVRDETPLRERASGLTEDLELPEEGVDFTRLVEAYEHQLIERAIKKAGGVKTRAAELLGLTFRQFRYKLAKFEKRTDAEDMGE